MKCPNIMEKEKILKYIREKNKFMCRGSEIRALYIKMC